MHFLSPTFFKTSTQYSFTHVPPDDDSTSDSQSTFQEDQGHYFYRSPESSGSSSSMGEEYGQPEVRSRLPLILQAQEGFLPVDDGSTRPYRLSTITERTERTEPSPHWRSRQPFLSASTPQTFPSSPTTSYGQLVGERAIQSLELTPNCKT